MFAYYKKCGQRWARRNFDQELHDGVASAVSKNVVAFFFDLVPPDDTRRCKHSGRFCKNDTTFFGTALGRGEVFLKET